MGSVASSLTVVSGGLGALPDDIRSSALVCTATVERCMRVHLAMASPCCPACARHVPGACGVPPSRRSDEQVDGQHSGQKAMCVQPLGGVPVNEFCAATREVSPHAPAPLVSCLCCACVCAVCARAFSRL